jgi:hydrogenase expression/formation protein HypE
MSGSDETIQLAHGGGGRLARELIEREILPRFGAGPLGGLPDAALLPAEGENELLFTTDSFVVQPIEFPGGNIGDLAVYGTANDLAVCGGLPKWLSLGLILEEGLPLAVLRRVLDSVERASRRCGVTVATGDTKVVARGQCDGLYVNTAGIGVRLRGFAPTPGRIRAGDRVLASGPLGDHGMAVMALRGGIGVREGPASDVGPVQGLVVAAAPHAGAVHFMRDPTRGGAAAVLNEAVAGRGLTVVLHERDIPVAPATRALADMLGIDVLHVACEGRVLLFCAAEAADGILEAWRPLPEGRHAVVIGGVEEGGGIGGERVVLETVAGGRRLVDVPRGELLPRIC